jgi:hypothetical protein
LSAATVRTVALADVGDVGVVLQATPRARIAEQLAIVKSLDRNIAIILLLVEMHVG